MTDYQKNITVNKPAAEVYAAITEQIAGWWSEDLGGSASSPGDRFDIAFNDTRKTFEILEAVPNTHVVWKCLKAHIDMASLKNKAEWVDTRVLWTICADGQNTTLNFLHEGLNQDLECYGVCQSGWDYYLASLLNYLSSGTGSPHKKNAAPKSRESQPAKG